MLGEMVEWSKAPHWKCGVGKLTEGSNPSLSAIFMLKFQQNIPTFPHLGLQNARCCAIISHNLLFQVFLWQKQKTRLDQ